MKKSIKHRHKQTELAILILFSDHMPGHLLYVRKNI